MFRSLTAKLLLAFLAVSLTGTLISGVVAVLGTANEFDQFVVTQEQLIVATRLTDYYATRETWEGVGYILQTRRGPGMGQRAGGPQQAVLVVDSEGMVVYPATGYDMGEILSPDEYDHGIALAVNGIQVGTMVVQGGLNARDPEQSAFLSRINGFLILGAAGGTVVALLLSALLAQTFTGPLRELTAATQAVARGKLGSEVTVRSRDELGQLAVAFNQMSRDLAQASAARKQMTADIAHDLRTPLSVILGYAESLSDGVLQGDPETYAVIHAEAQQLNRLVEDLRTLSLADAGELPLTPEVVQPRELLRQAAASQTAAAEQRQVRLLVEEGEPLPAVEVDPGRIGQVLGNLLANALRYTPAGGTIRLGARRENGQIVLTVADTGAGIPPQSLPLIFERSYRGDAARRQRDGESGLGLAIARSIVEAHNGSIEVDSVVDQGTTFSIRLVPSSVP